MKRKLLMGSIAFCGALAVVGSGFSSWYFENTIDNRTGNVAVHVTDLVDGIGTLTNNDADKSLYVILDQGTYSNKDDITKGISVTSVSGDVSDSNLGTAVASLSATYKIAADDATKLVAANVTSGTFTATIELSQAAQAYLAFDTTYTSATPAVAAGKLSVTASKLTYEYTVEYTASTEVNQTFSFDVSTTDYVNKLIQYATGKKPTDANAYNTMKTALDGKNVLSITYSYKVNA